MASLNHICNNLAAWLTEPAPVPRWTRRDWARCRRACLVHGVAPLLHTRLQGCTWIEPATSAWLAEQYRLNRLRVERMHDELAAILAAAYENTLPIMPLKGPILAALYYDDPAHRPMADLDILVYPQHRDSAAALLTRLGYVPLANKPQHIVFCKADNRAVVSRDGEHPDNPRKVELHTAWGQSLDDLHLDLTAALWARAAQTRFLDRPAYLAAPSQLWALALVHTSADISRSRARLLQLVDLAHLLPSLEKDGELPVDIDHRALYPAQVMLQRYFPGVFAASSPIARLSVPRSLRRRVERLDLVNSSHLGHRRTGLALIRRLRATPLRPLALARVVLHHGRARRTALQRTYPLFQSGGLSWAVYPVILGVWLGRLVYLLAQKIGGR